MAEKTYEGKSASAAGLEDYIHIASPGVVVATIALLIISCSILIWGFTGTIPVKETITGVTMDLTNEFVGYEDDNARAGSDDYVYVLCFFDANKYTAEKMDKLEKNVVLKMPDNSVFTGTIEHISIVPMDRATASSYFEQFQWLAEKAVNQDYSWAIAIKPDQDISQYQFMLTEVTFVVDQAHPIRFLRR